ncbi:acyl-CoA thioesterase [Rhodothalassium salexigens]|uniref:acyl-CoA thioesterase n=1 Tax=Rhodothalassium salexigens TaxID=1086 RepID=UPI001912A3E5|nr:acyl-CoA thioesterase [Rhodothalassium salexigens]MBK5912027.1 acyl-CoA thioesterase [Rhodothalassium salexigens]MBK5921215.1 acyl-CoA thioesterase [Rhodothalassium salexigens]
MTATTAAQAATDRREPVIRTAPRPADLNLNGHIFGGWILSQMDVAGGITAARRARGPVATVAVESMKFHRPILVGDLISLYTHIAQIGRTSITVAIDVLAERMDEPEPIKVTEGRFVFVAVDASGAKRAVPPA